MRVDDDQVHRSGRRARWRRRLYRLCFVLLILLVVDKTIDMTSDHAQVGRWDTVSGQQAYASAYDKVWADLPAPTAVDDVRTEFGVVRVYAWTGSGVAGRVPVLLLPGRSSGSPMWVENLPDFIAERPVYAMDPIGDAGMSVQSAPLRSFADIAEWLDQAMHGVGIDQAHVVGHSFGGARAAARATPHPQDLARVTLRAPVLTGGPGPGSAMFWATILTVPTPQSWRDRALAEIGGTSIDEVRERTPMSEMIDLGSKHYRAALPMPAVLSDAQIQTWTFPVYVAIASDKSLAGGTDAAARVSELLPGSTVRVWPNTTHSLPMQVRSELDAALASFWGTAD